MGFTRLWFFSLTLSPSLSSFSFEAPFRTMDSDNEEITFKINKEFADKYEAAKRGQELSGSMSILFRLLWFLLSVAISRTNGLFL